MASCENVVTEGITKEITTKPDISTLYRYTLYGLTKEQSNRNPVNTLAKLLNTDVIATVYSEL
jgi:hypothetical protein